MTTKIILSIFICFVFLNNSFAEKSVEELKAQAFANIQRAQEVVTFAEKIIKMKPGREGAEKCVTLYLEAALLYGDASRLFKAMGPTYVPQDIIDNFAQGERNCLNTVDQIRRMLNKGEIVPTKKYTIQPVLKELKEMTP